MLSLMRKHAKSWLIKLVLGAITIVFVFWGVGSYTGREGSRVALVDKESISAADLSQAYNQLLEQARQRFGDSLNQKLLESLNLRTQALNRLISQKLIFQEAARAGVAINNELVLASIMSEPIFQENGRFSPRLYQRVLSVNRLEPADYEEAQRRRMTIMAMESRLSLLDQTSAAELNAYFHWLKDEVKVSYAVFEPADFEGAVAIDKEALTTFFAENKEAYRVPEKVEVEYLAFEPKDFLAQVSLDEARIREFYDLTQESYAQAEQVKLDHIFFSLGPQASEDEIKQRREEAEAVLAKLSQGADFAQLAVEYSEGPTAEEGGKLGWLSQDQIKADLAEVIFQLQAGQVSDLIQAEYGLHIFKVEERQEARVRAFNEVRAEIEEQLGGEAARETALEAAEEAYGLSAGVSNLVELGREIGRKAAIVGPFSRQEPPPGVGSDPTFIEYAFLQPVGEVGPVIETEEGFYLLMVTKRNPSYLPELAGVVEAVSQDFIRQEAKRMAQVQAEAFLDKAKGGDWLDEARQAGLEVQLPPPFSRQGQVEGLGYDRTMSEAAFRLTDQNPWPSEIFEVGGKFAIIHFEDRLPAGEETFETERARLVNFLASQRSNEFHNAWLQTLRSRATIEIDQSML